MALFKKMSKAPDIVPDAETANHDDGTYDHDPEISEDQIPSSIEGGNPPPKRRIRFDEESTGDETKFSATVSVKQPAKVIAQTVERDTVYLSTYLPRDLHTRLRIQSLRTKKTLGAVIEEMIAKFCPE